MSQPTTTTRAPKRKRPVPPLEPNALTFRPRDACRMLGCGRTTLYSLLAAGALKAVKQGAGTLILGDSLRQYVASLPPAEMKAA